MSDQRSATENELLKDLIRTLHLYLSPRSQEELTTVQKELFADVIDEEYRRNGYEPFERWWRDSPDMEDLVREARREIARAVSQADDPVSNPAAELLADGLGDLAQQALTLAANNSALFDPERERRFDAAEAAVKAALETSAGEDSAVR